MALSLWAAATPLLAAGVCMPVYLSPPLHTQRLLIVDVSGHEQSEHDGNPQQPLMMIL